MIRNPATLDTYEMEYTLMESTTANGTIAPNLFPNYGSNFVLSFIIGILLLVGAVGSSLTIVVITTNKSLQTKANLFILSLCVSDLISALLGSPLWLYRRTWGFLNWEWGEFLCRFYWVVDYATNYVTSLHIVSFAILRFIAVTRPFYVAKLSRKIVVFYLLCLWVIAIGTAAPLGYLMGVDFTRQLNAQGIYWPSCSIADRDNCCIDQYKLYIDIVNTILFFIPFIVIIVISIIISHTVLMKERWRDQHSYSPSPGVRRRYKVSSEISTVSTSTPCTPPLRFSQLSQFSFELDRNIQENTPHVYRRTPAELAHMASGRNVAFPRLSKSSRLGSSKTTFLQLSLIVISFMIGYLPLTVYLIWSPNTPESAKATPYVDYWFGTTTYLCLRLSECMNPILYNAGCMVLRTKTKSMLKKLFCCKCA